VKTFVSVTLKFQHTVRVFVTKKFCATLPRLIGPNSKDAQMQELGLC
jgi:hypothetical protein